MSSHYVVVEKFINENNLKRVAEIGVYKGSLTRHVLACCPCIREYYAVDQWKTCVGPEYGKFALKTQEDWDKIYMKACLNLPLYRPLKIIRMPALEAVKLFPLPKYKGFLDFVYIDSSHFYKETLEEIKAWLPLVHPEGFIGGHDYAAKREEHKGVKKAVDEIFGEKNIKQGDDMVWWVQV